MQTGGKWVKCFQFYSIDHVALRHPRNGSVMIEAMIEVFKQYGNKWHIADFFTRVSTFQVNLDLPALKPALLQRTFPRDKLKP